MRKRPLALFSALLVALAAPGPARAATPEQMERVRLLSSLDKDVSAADRAAIEAALAVPGDLRLSREFADRTIPRWPLVGARAALRAKGERDPRGPWHRVARRFERLAAQVRGAQMRVLPRIPFDLDSYRATVSMLAGQSSLPWPGDPKRHARFTNRLMGHPDNQLGELCDYLAAYYRGLGLQVEQQTFDYQGKQYRNVVATLPGTSPERIVLADHFDVAPTADYELAALKEAVAYGLTEGQIRAIRGTHRTGRPVPGADDNASATAALMEAARLLVRQGRKSGPANGPRRGKTIQFLHLNGEEFPGDSYGAKMFVAQAQARRDPISAVIVLDMIGQNRSRNRVFQIAPGQDRRSMALANLATQAAAKVAPGYRPVVRLFDDHKSYLYNTDGQVFSTAGYPVILLNEHLNYHEDLERLGYHDEFDRTELIDWNYAKAIASTGIAAALLAAASPPDFAAIAQEQPNLQAPDHRVSHFQIELRYSPLYETLEAQSKSLGRELTDAELEALIAKDLGVVGDPGQHDTSMAVRLTTWFPQAGWKPIDFAAIARELRYLRAREPLARSAGR